MGLVTALESRPPAVGEADYHARMATPQPGILGNLPNVARFLTFQLAPDAKPEAAADLLSDAPVDEYSVVGLGSPLTLALDEAIPSLRPFPSVAGPGVAVPSTQAALWCWLHGQERGEIVHRARRMVAALEPAFELEAIVDGFTHAGGRDLTGYEDGTANPKGAEARGYAIIDNVGEGLDGSSMVAVQQWLHDLDAFEAHPPAARDNMMGRRLSDNEELEDAPPTAHVKRAEQEDFDPQAWVVRRSMPWADGEGEGLMFVSFGSSLDPFERILRRMLGLEDGIVDALFGFTRPISGGYYWCPPIGEHGLDLRALGL